MLYYRSASYFESTILPTKGICHGQEQAGLGPIARIRDNTISTGFCGTASIRVHAERLVQPVGQATLQSSSLAVRAGLDPTVHIHGSRGLAGLARSQEPSRSPAFGDICNPASHQCQLVSGILRVTESRFGLCRNNRTLGSNSSYHQSILPGFQVIWLADGTLSWLGKFCSSAELVPLALEQLSIPRR